MSRNLCRCRVGHCKECSNAVIYDCSPKRKHCSEEKEEEEDRIKKEYSFHSVKLVSRAVAAGSVWVNSAAFRSLLEINFRTKA